MTNLDLIRSIYTSPPDKSVEHLQTVLSDDVIWIEAAGFPTAGTYVGFDAITKNVFQRLAIEWEGFKTQPNNYIADGDQVAAFGIYSGTYKETGKYFEATFVHLWQFKNEKIIKMEQFVDSAIVQSAMK